MFLSYVSIPHHRPSPSQPAMQCKRSAARDAASFAPASCIFIANYAIARFFIATARSRAAVHSSSGIHGPLIASNAPSTAAAAVGIIWLFVIVFPQTVDGFLSSVTNCKNRLQLVQRSVLLLLLYCSWRSCFYMLIFTSIIIINAMFTFNWGCQTLSEHVSFSMLHSYLYALQLIFQ